MRTWMKHTANATLIAGGLLALGSGVANAAITDVPVPGLDGVLNQTSGLASAGSLLNQGGVPGLNNSNVQLPSVPVAQERSLPGVDVPAQLLKNLPVKAPSVPGVSVQDLHSLPVVSQAGVGRNVPVPVSPDSISAPSLGDALGVAKLANVTNALGGLNAQQRDLPAIPAVPGVSALPKVDSLFPSVRGVLPNAGRSLPGVGKLDVLNNSLSNLPVEQTLPVSGLLG